MDVARPRVALATSFGCVILAALVTAWHPLVEPDAWWHVAAGMWMLDHGGPPPLLLFGDHGCPDATPIDYRIGFPVFGLLWRLGGPAALFVFVVVAVIALSFLTWYALRRRMSPLSAGVWGALISIALAARIGARTEVFSYFLVLTLLALLGRALDPQLTRRAFALRLVAVTALFALWPQLHSGIVFGAVVVAALIGEALLASRFGMLRRSALLLVCTVAGILVGGGHELLINAPLERQIAHEVLAVAEWRSPLQQIMQGRFDPTLFSGAVLGGVYLLALLLGGKSQRFAGMLVGGAFFALALEAQRNIAIFALVSVVWLPRSNDLPRRLRTLAMTTAVVVSAVLLVLTLKSRPTPFGTGPKSFLSDVEVPLGAATWAKGAGLSGRVFGSFSNLNYLLVDTPQLTPVWTGRRSFSRPCGELLTGAAYLPNRFFARADDRWRFDFVLVRHAQPEEDALFRFLVENDWTLLYFGSRDALFARPGAAHPPQRIPRTASELFDSESPQLPDDDKSQLALAACQRLAFVGELDAATGLCAAAVELDPHSVTARDELFRLQRFIKDAPR